MGPARPGRPTAGSRRGSALATTTRGRPSPPRLRAGGRRPLGSPHDPDAEPTVPLVVAADRAHTRAEADRPRADRRRWPALDGLRAFAVLAVLCYHAGVSWLPGGLLGVDLFFVLSGFLITGLLLAELERSGRVNLAAFWAGRARRLLPALLLVLLAVAAYARLVAPADTAGSVRADALSTLFYVANWRFALSHQGYFNTLAPPSPLRHTWSLAVEEQFYLLWPLMVLGVVGWAARRPRRRRRQRATAPMLVRRVAVAGAVASAATALVLSLRHADTSRIYYGTDTRSQALFVGAALAATVAGGASVRTRRGAAGYTGLGLLAAAAIATVWVTVGGDSPGLYRGGFLAFALAVAALVASVVLVPTSPLARALGWGPLRYVGRISYGVYLWHWPLFLTMTASRTHLTGTSLLAARFAATFAVSAASYHLLEQPIRTRQLRLPMPRLATPVTIALVATVVVGATGAHGPQIGVSAAAVDRLAAANAAAPIQPRSTAAAAPVRVLLEGDSVALTFGLNLPPSVTHPLGVDLVDKGIEGCGITGSLDGRIQGREGAPRPECIPWVQNYRADVTTIKPDVAVLLVGRWEVTDRLLDGRWTHIGEADYDTFIAHQLDTAIDALSTGGTKVALFTAPVFKPQEAPNGSTYSETDANRVIGFNRLLRAAVDRHPGVATLVDFGHVLTPGDTYVDSIDGQVVRWSDGVHIAAAGSRLAARELFPELVTLGRSRGQSDDQSDMGAINRSVPPTTGPR